MAKKNDLNFLELPIIKMVEAKETKTATKTKRKKVEPVELPTESKPDLLFQLDHTVSTDGTFLVGTILISPAAVVNQFGAPEPADDWNNSTGSYTFVSKEQEVFTLYDWQQVSEATPYVEFWEQTKQIPLHIGSRDVVNLPSFISFLREATS